MGSSKFLAKVLGLYLIIVAIAFCFNMSFYSSMVISLLNNGALMFLAALMTLIIGLLLVISHNVWQLNWRVLITIIGWATLIKAICLLFCPSYMSQMNLQMLQNTTVICGSLIFDLIIGLILLYFGFKK